MSKIWHLLRGVTIWTIWIERNDKVFNHEQWHETKVKHQIWEETYLLCHGGLEAGFRRYQDCRFSEVAILLGFDKTWGARNVLCKRHNLHIEWNWRRRGN